jgi:hypothetical protein
MAKYRKKPVVVDAFQWSPEMGEVGGVKFDWDARHVFKEYGIQTLEGWMKVTPGAWIVTGVHGEHYEVKPDVFELTYEGVNA